MFYRQIYLAVNGSWRKLTEYPVKLIDLDQASLWKLAYSKNSYVLERIWQWSGVEKAWKPFSAWQYNPLSGIMARQNVRFA